jgi:hypothetical protein
MHNAIRYGTRGSAILLLLAASASTAPSRVEALPGAVAALGQDPPPQKCCFRHQSYAGTCAVAPAKDETCEQILDYLNNPMSQGKSYCNSTTIRGGWQAVSCETKR